MIAERLYAILLLAFPRRFRDRYGDDMRRIFAARYGLAAARGRWPAGRFVFEAAADVLRNAPLERLSATRRWLRPGAAHDSDADSSSRRSGLLTSIAIDLRHAVRMWARTPGFSGLAILALALGIGGASAIYSVARGLLLNPLPYEHPDRLVMVWSDNTREGRPAYPMSPANFLDYKASARMVERAEAMFSFITAGTLRANDGVEAIAVSVVSPGMFELLGRSASVGRALTAGDAGGAIVLSDAFWTRRFGRDPSVVGRRLDVENASATVVGVMPPDFTFPFQGMLGPSGFTTKTAVDVWTVLDPASPASRFVDADKRPVRNVHFLSVLARLAPGASLEQARDEARAIAARLERAFPDVNTGLGSNVVALHEQAVGQMRPALRLLAAAAGFVLLLAAVNVANLVLARGVSRQKELAVRSALGAGQLRLVQQTLSETVLLSAVGGALGLILGHQAARAFVALAPRDTPRLAEIGLDWRVGAFTAALSLLTGVALGLAPVLAVEQSTIVTALNDSGRGNSGLRSRRLRSILATAEVTFAVVLTVGAGLLLRSFVSLVNVNPGFEADRLLTLQITLPSSVSTPDARRAFYRHLFERLEAVPGVQRAGGTTRLPLGSTNVTTRVAIEGRGIAASDRVEVEFRRAVHAYFSTMGMPILHGRDFSDNDGPGSPPVVIVNQAMARTVWGDDDPVGRRVRMDDAAPWSTVIGVVGDVHHANLDGPPAPEMYIYYLAGPPVSPFIVLRTAGDPGTMAGAVRAELKAIDRSLVVYDLRTGEDLRSLALSPRRFIAVLGGLFGALALALAAVGVYGVMTLTVSERVQELGIRMALGAAPRSVFMLVVGQGLMLAAGGVAIGVALSIALMPLMASQLFGVSALDPATLAGVPSVLVLTALLACAVPAWRAMRVDPMAALRHE